MHIFLGRFLVHDREDEKMELFVTKNFGETFSHAGDYIKSFYFDHREVTSFCSKSAITYYLFSGCHPALCVTNGAKWQLEHPQLLLLLREADRHPSGLYRSQTIREERWFPLCCHRDGGRKFWQAAPCGQTWRKVFFSSSFQQHITFIFRQVCGCRVPWRSEPPGLPCGWSDLRWWLAGHSQPCRQFVFALHQWYSIRVWGGENVF